MIRSSAERTLGRWRVSNSNYARAQYIQREVSTQFDAFLSKTGESNTSKDKVEDEAT